MENRNGSKNLKYCKDCEYWNREANLPENINKAADTRDVEIYCPLGFDGSKKRGWYSPAICRKGVKDLPAPIKSYLEGIVID